MEAGDITWADTCPVLGIPLFINRNGGMGGSSDNSPSIERIRPGLGYVKGNVLVISMLANRIKSNATVEQLCKAAAFYKELLT